jgi:hypothetical protein
LALHLRDAPPIEALLVPSGGFRADMREPPMACVAPAPVNAIAAATGQRGSCACARQRRSFARDVGMASPALRPAFRRLVVHALFRRGGQGFRAIAPSINAAVSPC